MTLVTTCSDTHYYVRKDGYGVTVLMHYQLALHQETGS